MKRILLVISFAIFLGSCGPTQEEACGCAKMGTPGYRGSSDRSIEMTKVRKCGEWYKGDKAKAREDCNS
jgi:hypothetical protein